MLLDSSWSSTACALTLWFSSKVSLIRVHAGVGSRAAQLSCLPTLNRPEIQPMAWTQGATRTFVGRPKTPSRAPSRSSQLPRARRGRPRRPGAPIRAASRSSTDHHRPASPAHRNSAYPWHHRLPSAPHEVDARLDMSKSQGASATDAVLGRLSHLTPATGRTPELSGWTLNPSGQLGRAGSSSARWKRVGRRYGASRTVLGRAPRRVSITVELPAGLPLEVGHRHEIGGDAALQDRRRPAGGTDEAWQPLHVRDLAAEGHAVAGSAEGGLDDHPVRAVVGRCARY